MPDPIVIHIPKGLESASVALTDEVGAALRNAGLSMERRAKALAPKMTGNLKRSISSSVAPIGGNPTAIVMAQAKYAASVDQGAKPHTPPFAPIQRWATRKGIPEAAGAIWITIRRQGIKAQPFMTKAFEEKKESAIAKVQEAIKAVIERMSIP